MENKQDEKLKQSDLKKFFHIILPIKTSMKIMP